MRKLVCLSILALSAPAAARAVEIVPFAGYGDAEVTFSTGVVCVRAPCPSIVHGRNGPLLGLAVDFPIASRLELEVLVSRQMADLRLADSFELLDGDQIVLRRPPDADLEVSHLQVGLLRFWQLERFEPYGVFGVGVSRVDAERVAGSAAGFDEVRASASLGAGVRYRWSDRLGVRAELRGYRVEMPEGTRGEPLWNLGGSLDQLLGTTGLTIRW